MKFARLIPKLFHLYSFLFIFSAVNREFLLFGLDLRFIVLPLSVVLIFLSLFKPLKISAAKKTEKNSAYIGLCLFFIWCLLSNISWFWNGLEIRLDQMINQNILLLNNLLAIITYKRYQPLVNSQVIRKTVVFSCLVLVVSFVLTGMGLPLKDISGSDVRSMNVSTVMVEHKNVYGGDFRIAGYAEDANYASIFLLAGALAAVQLKIKKIYRWLLAIIFVIALGFAASKTVILSVIVAVLYLIIYRRYKTSRKLSKINFGAVILAPVASIILPKIKVLASIITLRTRFALWDVARQAFLRSPLIGNGISASRSAINARYYNDWYVHPHNNYWQIMAEAGAVGMILFLYAVTECLNSKRPSLSDRLLMISFIVFGLTYEIIQLQIMPYILFIPLLYSDTKKESAK